MKLFPARSMLVVVLLALVFSLWGISRLELSSNNRLFFSEQDSYYSEFLSFEDIYGANSELVFLVSCSNKCSVSSAKAAVQTLDELAWSVRGVQGVSSVFSFPIVYADSAGDLTVTEPYGADCEASEDCQILLSTVLEKVRGRLVSMTGADYVVVANLYLDSTVADIVALTMRDIDALESQFVARHPEFSLSYTGAVPMMNAFFVASQEDLTLLLPLALAVLFVALCFLFRDLRLPALLLFHSSFAVVCTLGAMGFLGIVLNTATSTLPLVVITLVVATNMHIYVDVLKDGVRGSLAERRAVLRRVFRSNVAPISLATFTTMLGLASMLSVNSPPLRELGVWSAFGVFCGYVFAFAVAPTFFSALGTIEASDPVVGIRSIVNRYAKRIEFARSHFVVLLLGFAFIVLGLKYVEFDEDFVEYFPQTSEFRVGAEAIERSLHSPYHVEIDLVASEESVLGVRARKIAYDLSEYLRGQPEVVNVLSLYDHLELVSSGLGIPSAEHRIASASTMEQLLLAFELGLEDGQALDRYVSSARDSARFSVLLRDVSMKDIRGLELKINDWFEGRSHSETDGIELVVTGEGLVTAKLSVESLKQMALGVLVSLSIGGVLLALALRNVHLALFLIIITVATTALGVSIWSILVGSIGLSCTLVIAVTVGVVVDDAIHVLYRFASGVEDLKLSRTEAAAYSIHRAGPAIASSTFVLCLGFAVLAFSSFAMNRDYGVGAAVVVLIALLFNLFVTPKLLSSTISSR